MLHLRKNTSKEKEPSLSDLNNDGECLFVGAGRKITPNELKHMASLVLVVKKRRQYSSPRKSMPTEELHRYRSSNILCENMEPQDHVSTDASVISM